MNVARVSIQTADFDLSQEVAALRAGDKRVGAVCSFVGTVRDRNDGSSVASMELEHYPGMTENAIEAMIDEAHRRFDIRARAWCIASGCCSRATRSCWWPWCRRTAARASRPASS
jgi:molybdopterin synthase catalytic subunit